VASTKLEQPLYVAQASLSAGAGTPRAGGADLSGHVVEAFLTSYVGIGFLPVAQRTLSPGRSCVSKP
jgi:hypothetical protein